MLLSTVRDSRGASEQMAGILATLKNHLTPFVSRDVLFALSGKESLAVNDPGSPRVLVLSNGEEVRRVLNPLISTVLKTLMRLMNKPGQYPCVFCADNLASLYIPGLTDFLSTARSNRIAAFLGFGISANWRSVMAGGLRHDFGELRTPDLRHEHERRVGTSDCGYVRRVRA